MGYPYGPQQGQGYPPVGQQGYGYPPMGQQGYAYGGYPAPGQGYPARPVSGGTGIAAASLALLISVAAGIGTLITFSVLSDSENGRLEVQPDGSFARESVELSGAVMVGLALGGVACLLWLLGAILLFRRKTAGRVIVIILSALATVGGLVSLLSLAAAPVGSGATLGIALAQAGFAVLVLCLAAAPSTGRWIQAARTPAYPQGPYPRY
ncbi:hypothetical protein [Nocardia sp. AG03]|uniref:hypothetical protein n=1 Tax=Nocardia sp. AG03 TaxID=3025312 RepID=UPI00241883F2|nr:hypothetical protein [Nocardia sp. AG03]